ncbi:MAG TPA: hypothetical protein VFY66_19935 [Anaerolineales bacterium]|nr:hypothetical protein [Anaerolineales bacterium]
MPKHHMIISGTGRAGTTFLVQLLTELGLDTGFKKGKSVDPTSHAGMELDIRDPNAPYVIKSPWLCDYLDEVLQNGDIVVDQAIVPMRDLFSAAQSRREVTRKAQSGNSEVPGGLWHTKNPEDQETILVTQLYKLFFALAKHDVPLVLLLFPRLVKDPRYLYQKIRFLLGDIRYDTFLVAFQNISRPELVHDFAREKGTSDDVNTLE